MCRRDQLIPDISKIRNVSLFEEWLTRNPSLIIILMEAGIEIYRQLAVKITKNQRKLLDL
jgi:hypothetical protein